MKSGWEMILTRRLLISNLAISTPRMDRHWKSSSILRDVSIRRNILTRQSKSWVGWYEVRVFTAIEFSEWQLNEIASGFELPVQVSHAGDGSGRLFVVEHKGRIRILKDGVIDDAPFLDISDRVKCCGEQGLLNVAFPPTYIDIQHFYVSYTNAEGETVISRFKTTSNPDKADPDSEEILLTIPQPNVNTMAAPLYSVPETAICTLEVGMAAALRISRMDKIPVRCWARFYGSMWNLSSSPTTFPPATRLWRLTAIARKFGHWAYAIPGDLPLTARPALSTFPTRDRIGERRLIFRARKAWEGKTTDGLSGRGITAINLKACLVT